MDNKIKFAKFRQLIQRKTPCIIFIEDTNDPINNKINKQLDIYRKEFPFVLYYKIDIKDYTEWDENKSLYGPYNIIRFESNRITSVINGENTYELYKLFWQVYADSCTFYFDRYCRILHNEKRMSRTAKKCVLPPGILNSVENIVGETISKYLEADKFISRAPIFRLHKNSPLFNFKSTSWKLSKSQSEILNDRYKSKLNKSLKNKTLNLANLQNNQKDVHINDKYKLENS